MTQELDSAAVARYLSNNAAFFEEHAELLARIRITSPIAGRSLSLQERQMEILRDKIKGLELHLSNLIRVGEDNLLITQRMQDWCRALLTTRDDADLPHTLVDGLRTIFGVPHVTLRVWDLGGDHAGTWFTAPASEDARLFANGLRAPFCGKNQEFEAAGWLDNASEVSSVAMMALRGAGQSDAFGLLVMGSPDETRFTSDMATDFLQKISETASAAIGRLRD